SVSALKQSPTHNPVNQPGHTRCIASVRVTHRSSTMQITKTGSAHWTGQIKDGKGTISTESGALRDHPYGFNTRFEGVKGSNPEELIGAAHAACFTMFLSKLLGDAGF